MERGKPVKNVRRETIGQDLKSAILEGVSAAGGHEGMVGFMRHLAQTHPEKAADLIKQLIKARQAAKGEKS